MCDIDNCDGCQFKPARRRQQKNQYVNSRAIQLCWPSMTEKREGCTLAKEMFAGKERGKFEDPRTFSYEIEG